jgi:soluble lytic murein transglycosylase-like protein
MTQLGGGPVRPARKARRALLCPVVFLMIMTALSAADLKKKFDPVIREVAARNRIDPELIHAVIKAESNYDPFAVSAKGALGLMQLMPDTARHYGVLNVFDAAQNVEGGVKYIKDLIKLYNGKTRLVLAAYNAGQEAVRRYDGIPPYKETRDYIARIQSTYKSGFIRVGTRIYKYYDDNGRLVLTNDENLAKSKNKSVAKSPSER